MSDQKLLDYIHFEQSRGFSLTDIEKHLLSHGYTQEAITNAFLEVRGEKTRSAFFPSSPSFEESREKPITSEHVSWIQLFSSPSQFFSTSQLYFRNVYFIYTLLCSLIFVVPLLVAFLIWFSMITASPIYQALLPSSLLFFLFFLVFFIVSVSFYAIPLLLSSYFYLLSHFFQKSTLSYETISSLTSACCIQLFTNFVVTLFITLALIFLGPSKQIAFYLFLILFGFSLLYFLYTLYAAFSTIPDIDIWHIVSFLALPIIIVLIFLFLYYFVLLDAGTIGARTAGAAAGYRLFS